ncbi:MAG: hypothetical protein ABI438_07610, partial [Dermatophilaceae bacterium]
MREWLFVGGQRLKGPPGDAKGRAVNLKAYQRDWTDAVVEAGLTVESFEIPPHTDDLVERARLRERLELGVAGPLTLVSAPAGMGKTVAVAAWASGPQAPGPIAWVNLEASDGSRTRFRSSFMHGL